MSGKDEQLQSKMEAEIKEVSVAANLKLNAINSELMRREIHQVTIEVGLQRLPSPSLPPAPHQLCLAPFFTSPPSSATVSTESSLSSSLLTSPVQREGERDRERGNAAPD